mgnify:CR=1 FL=1
MSELMSKKLKDSYENGFDNTAGSIEIVEARDNFIFTAGSSSLAIIQFDVFFVSLCCLFFDFFDLFTMIISKIDQ